MECHRFLGFRGMSQWSVDMHLRQGRRSDFQPEGPKVRQLLVSLALLPQLPLRNGSLV